MRMGLVAAAVVAVGCGPSPTPATPAPNEVVDCGPAGRAGGEIATQALLDPADLTARGDAARAAGVEATIEACRRDGWSAAAAACVAGAGDGAAMAACDAQLTEAQRAGYAEAWRTRVLPTYGNP